MATEILAEVEYRNIDGFPGYRVGSDGTVWTSWQVRGTGAGNAPVHYRGEEWKPRALSDGTNGHLWVTLYANGVGRKFYVHRLVLEAFTGQCPDGMECCHNDGNPKNNCVLNLRWDTRKANGRDASEHGALVHGESHWAAKLTEDDVREIRHLHKTGVNMTRLARMFGVGRYPIRAILAGKTWKHVPE